MLTSIHIQGFKGFWDTKIPELRRVNLILGGQNSGKTSLLEAIVFALGNYHQIGDLATLFRVNEGKDAARFWDAVIGKKNAPRTINTSIGIQNGHYAIYFPYEKRPDQYYLDTHFSAHGRDEQFQVAYLNNSTTPLTDKQKHAAFFSVMVPQQRVLVSEYGKVFTAGKKNQLLKLLQAIEPRLITVETASPDNENRIYADLGDSGVFSLPQMGHGFSKLFHLYCNLLVEDARFAFIDEIENGIHYTALPILWHGIANIARELDIQIFATTHSYECIQAASKVFEATPEEFQLIRLERTEDNNIKPILIRDENLTVVLESNWEIR